MHCKHCGKEFPDPTWPNTKQIYCSSRCNKAAWNKAHREELRLKWKEYQVRCRVKRLQSQRKYNKSAKGIHCKIKYYEAHKKELFAAQLQAYKSDPHVRALYRSRELGRELLKKLKVPKVCNDCGATERIECHHRNFNSLDNDPTNLVWLCKQCHSLRHSDPLGF
jgi:hypothetical protein